MKTIDNFNFSGKKVLIRVDFNVPLSKNREITDDTRIRESIPTIKKILNDGGSVIIMSHLGRPKGGYEEAYSLAPIVPVLSKYLNTNVIFNPELIGDNTKKVCANLKPKEVVLLENLRFHKEEEGASEAFAKELASLGDAYVNDAFATAHRAHASTAIIAKFFPNSKFFGYLLANEVRSIEKVLNNPVSPFTAIIGGAKISTKLPILKNLLNKVDNLIIGGGMAFTFTKALGGKIGNSLVEDDQIEEAKLIINQALLKGVNLYLPTDAIIAESISNDVPTRCCNAEEIPDGFIGLDIGEKSRNRFAQVICQSKTILWNGPLGVFEMSNFAAGTKSIGIAVAAATQAGSFSLIGGGDSVAAINKYDLADMMSYVSTGGGAMLEYLEGITLPGIKALLD